MRPPRPPPSRPSSAPPPREPIEPPPGVPTRLWLDLLHEHPALLARLRTLDEDDEAPLATAIADLVNQRLAEEAGDPADDSEDAEAARIEQWLERYAALVVAGTASERTAFEREHEPLLELLRDPEGAALLAEMVAEERALRRQLPTG